MFKVKILTFYLTNFSQMVRDKTKITIVVQIGSHAFTIALCQYECCTSWPWPTFSRLRILKCEYLENGESQRKMLKCDFYRGWYSPSNVTIANVLLRDLDLNFQGHKFETIISRKRWELLQKSIMWLLPRLIFAAEWLHCYTPWHLPSFSR